MKRHSVRRIALGVLAGMGLLAGGVWLLIHTLGNNPQYLYAGKPIQSWRQQLDAYGTGASNEAFVVVSNRVIPQLVETMFHDTHDSSLRMFLVDTLNGLPGVGIFYLPAEARRADAARRIGQLGPAAKSAVPALVQVLKGKDAVVQEAAISSLGEIHSDPGLVIPLLIACLDDDNLNDEAALALGNYGRLAKAAVPKIIPMLHAGDDDAQAAAIKALKEIDPEAYAKASQANQSATNALLPQKSGSPRPEPRP